MKLTKEQLSEQAGSMVAARMLEAMKEAPLQGARLEILQSGLRDVMDTPDSLNGFSAVLIAWLDRAMGIE